MNRVAAFVDAGYLFAQGSVRLTGQKRPRGDLTLDTPKVVQAIEAFATGVSGLPLLRTYWYDGTSTGPTAQHLALAYMPGVKVRLGYVNRAGEQKGVDSLIVTDMIDLARNRGMADAILLSGDEDLRVGVQQAQGFGIRVHLLGIKPNRGSVSLFLLQEADTTHEWIEDDLRPFLAFTPRSPEPPVQAPSTTAATPGALVEPFLGAAEEVAGLVTDDAREALIASYRTSSQIPREFDGPLLAIARRFHGGDLDARQKRRLRARFVDIIEERLRYLDA